MCQALSLDCFIFVIVCKQVQRPLVAIRGLSSRMEPIPGAAVHPWLSAAWRVRILAAAEARCSVQTQPPRPHLPRRRTSLAATRGLGSFASRA